jgi:hypothetical protein
MACILHVGTEEHFEIANYHLNLRVKYCTGCLGFFQSSISGNAFEELFTVTGDRSRGVGPALKLCALTSVRGIPSRTLG